MRALITLGAFVVLAADPALFVAGVVIGSVVLVAHATWKKFFAWLETEANRGQ
jgi:hypothetical protein